MSECSTAPQLTESTQWSEWSQMVIMPGPPAHVHFLDMCVSSHYHEHQWTLQSVIRPDIVKMIFRQILCRFILLSLKVSSLTIFITDFGSITTFVTAGLNIGALANAGTTVAEKSANLVVDLLCGCGCR